MSIAVSVVAGITGGFFGYSVGGLLVSLWKLREPTNRKPTTSVFSADTKAYIDSINCLPVTEESLKDQTRLNTFFNADFIPDTYHVGNYTGPVENYPWATQTPPTEGEQEKNKRKQ